MKYEKMLPTILLLILLFCVASGVVAQNCDDLVVDNAGLFGSGRSKVEAAVQTLRNTGAKVYVRTEKTTKGMRDIDALMHSVQESCPSWQLSGGRNPDLVVVYITVAPRGLGIYTGDSIDGAVSKDEITQIRKAIGGKLGKAEYDAGVILGVEAIGRKLSAGGYIKQPPSQANPQISDEPMDFSWLKKGFYWLILILGIAGFGYIVIVLPIQFIRRQNRVIAEMRAKKQEVISKVTEWMGVMTDIGGRIVLLGASVSPEAKADLEQKLVVLRNEVDSASGEYARVSNSVDFSEAKWLQYGSQFKARTKEYGDVLKLFAGCQRSYDSLLTEVKDFEWRVENMSANITKRTDEVDNIIAKINEASAGGYRVEKYATLATHAKQELVTAAAQLVSGEFYLAEAAYAEAGKLIKKAKPGADVAETKQTLIQEITESRSQIEASKANVQNRRKDFDQITANFCPKSWESLTGNGGEAERLINQAVSIVTEAETCVDMENQQWDKARKLLDQVSVMLKKVGTLMNSITSLKKSLEKAKAQAVTDLASAQGDLTKAKGYEGEHDADIGDDVKPDLEAEGASLAAIALMLKQPKPDYFDIINQIKAVHDLIDITAKKCRTEHEEAERLRKRAATSLANAKSRAKKAAEYLQDHPSHADSMAMQQLADCARNLKAAQDASDLTEIIRLAEASDSYGKDAYDRTKSSYDDEVDRQAEAARAAVQSSSSTTNWNSGGSYSSASWATTSSSDNSGGWSGGGSDNSGGW